MIVNTAPSIWPPVQRIVLPISGEYGYVISTINSSATGKSANALAPRSAHTTMLGASP